jgi:hypothetical protein
MAVFFLSIGTACVAGMLFCVAGMARNGWVYRRRGELIDWHFGPTGPRRGDFDSLYGSYHDWMAIRNWLCWNPAKLAGLKRWVA